MTTDPTEILNRQNAEIAQIRGYVDLTEEAKNKRIAEVTARARAEYAEAREAGERERAERVAKAEAALFQTPYPYAASDLEQAQIRALRRGAYESVEALLARVPGPEDAGEELDRLLTRAERTQDPELADAVYHVATERGARNIADAYLEKRPHAKRRWEEFVAASQEARESQGVEGLLARSITDRAFSSEAAG
jgi:DNA-nicking Smr family endonuclease